MKSTFAPVGYLRLAAGAKPVLEAALIPGEMYSELSIGGVSRDPNADFPDAPEEKAIERMMTAPVKMLFGLANDEIGYIIPKSQWDEKPPFTFGAQKRWYGEVNSVGPEAAPMIADAFSRLVSGTGREAGKDSLKTPGQRAGGGAGEVLLAPERPDCAGPALNRQTNGCMIRRTVSRREARCCRT